MTSKTFFEKFELFADAPDAVPKMRRLVLDLAFTSRLLPSSHSSNGWQHRKLKTLTTKIGSGATPSGGKNNYKDSGVPLIRSMNVHFRGFVSKGLAYIDDEQASKLENVVVQESDVLLNITGASIGRVTTAPPKMEGARVNQHVAIIRTTNEIDSQFLSKYLASPRVQLFIDEIQVGATRQALTKGKIQEFEIPLPPLAEQKRIVAKVDELMALCDELEAQQRERDIQHAVLSRAALARFAEAPTPQNLNFIFHKSYDIPPADLRKSILTLAVQGKLVPQDPKDEPADRIIENVTRERNYLIGEKLIPKAKKLSPARENPFLLPSLWCWTQLGLITHLIEYGTSQKSNNDASKIPVYRMGDIQNGTLYDERLKYVSPQIDDLPRLFHDPGDIRFNRTNSAELVGKAAVYKGTPNTHTFASYLIRVRVPAHFLDPDFIGICFQAPYFRETQIEPEVIQQCGQANFNGTKLAHTLFAIPPLAEQRRIVAKVDQLMALVDQMETQLTESRATAQNLLQAVVAELTQSSANGASHSSLGHRPRNPSVKCNKG